jgi:hypothetical protein
MFMVAWSDGLSGIWLTLIWCRGAVKARLPGPDMTMMGGMVVSESPEPVSLFFFLISG